MISLRTDLNRALTIVVLGLVSLGIVKGTLFSWRTKLRFDLVAAASKGDATEVKQLISAGASPNAEHLEGSSALWWAVECQSLPTVKTLLAAGANPNSRGQYNSVIENALAQLEEAEGAANKQNAKAIIRVLRAGGAKASFNVSEEATLGKANSSKASTSKVSDNISLHPKTP